MVKGASAAGTIELNLKCEAVKSMNSGINEKVR